MKNLIAALAVLFLISSCALIKTKPCPKEDFLIYFETPFGVYYSELRKGEIDEYFERMKKEKEKKNLDEMAME